MISAQVANDGYRAFNKAHTNMDKIRLQSMQTPDNLKSTLQALFKVREQAIDATHVYCLKLSLKFNSSSYRPQTKWFGNRAVQILLECFFWFSVHVSQIKIFNLGYYVNVTS